MASRSLAQQLQKPENQIVRLDGTIKLIHDFGPPGYGEDPKHDTHVSYWALVVPVPVNVPCTPTKPEFAADECGPAKALKLFFLGDELKKLSEMPAAKWSGHLVSVKGKLHRADTAGEMTPIYMDVVEISGIPKRTY
jgi:hypothetical protein